MNASYSTPTRVITGLGCRGVVANALLELGGTKISLVVDVNLSETDIVQQFVNIINQTSGLELVHQAPSKVDPTTEAAESSAAEALRLGADIVLGIGGGSALSLAKAVALLITNPAPVLNYAGIDQAKCRPAPFVAVPTTAGSGSEVSNAFVLYDESQRGNVGIRGWGYEPDVALLDGELLLTLPDIPFLDATIDALSHGFEALWSLGRTRFTDVPAFAAVATIREELPKALETRSPDSLQALLEASTLANFACGNSGLALVHALSSASSIRIPHGRQNAVFLPLVAEFNRPHLPDEVRVEIDLLYQLYERLNVPTKFKTDHLPDEPIQVISQASASSPFLRNNVRPATDADIRLLAQQAIN